MGYMGLSIQSVFKPFTTYVLTGGLLSLLVRLTQATAPPQHGLEAAILASRCMPTGRVCQFLPC